MKSKLTTYLLILAAIGVWGVVAWKIFSGRPPGENLATAGQSPSMEIDRAEKDTLWLNYPDPFLKSAHTISKNIPTVSRVTPRAAAVAVRSENAFPDQLGYHGRITKGKSDSYLIGINGSQYLMKEGETEQGYRLVRVFADSVHIGRNGDICCLKIAE